MLTYLITGTVVVVSLICFGRQDLINKLSFHSYAILKRHEWYRIITHGFVHADVTHLLVNMFTFCSFGVYVESLFADAGPGQRGFLGLYFGGMIFSSLYDLIKYRDNSCYHSVGASGAVSAVLFASILFDPWGMILLFAVIPVPGIVFGILYLIYCRYMAERSADNINHNAHFCGAIYGLVFPILLQPSLIDVFLNRLKHIPWLS
jgi:membrane associated rhomboid family serine protease